MKTKLISLLIILKVCVVFSQHCEETTTASLDGEIYDFQLENCTTAVTIRTLNEDTILHGITLIDAMESINIKASESYRISIKPDDALDFIDIVATTTFITVEDHLAAKELRSNGGNTEREEKDFNKIQIYPNPVDSVLFFENAETILYYKIVDAFGLTVKEGELPSNYQLQLSALTEGTYYLLLQDEHEILLTRLYKN